MPVVDVGVHLDDTYACLHPDALIETTVASEWPQHYWRRANSYTCQRGFAPGVAYLLMAKRDVDAIDKNAAHTITFSAGAEYVRLVKMYFVKATCMSGLISETSPYLVELRDCRVLCEMTSYNKRINVRQSLAPIGSETTPDLYYSESLNSGALWTWNTLVANIWTTMPSGVTATAPTFPVTPEGSPENLRFDGYSAWEALKVVLRVNQMTLAYDPSSGEFSIVKPDDQNGEELGLLVDVHGRRVYDFEPIEGDAAKEVEKVDVVFRVVDKYTGQGWDQSRDDRSFEGDVHIETVATGIAGAVVGTRRIVRDSMLAIKLENGSIDNTSELSSRATQLAGALYATHTKINRYYGLVTSIVPGAGIGMVRWRQYSTRSQPSGGVEVGGMITEISTGGNDIAAEFGRDELPQARWPDYQLETYLGKLDDNIEAMSDSDEPGVGTVSIYGIDKDSPQVVQDMGWNVEAMNPLDIDRGSTEFSLLHRDPYSRQFMLGAPGMGDIDVIWCKPYSGTWGKGQLVFPYEEVSSPYSTTLNGLQLTQRKNRRFNAYRFDEVWAQHVDANGNPCRHLPGMAGVALQTAGNTTDYWPVAIGGVVPAIIATEDMAIAGVRPEWAYVFPQDQGDVTGKTTRPPYLYGSQCREWWNTPHLNINDGANYPIDDSWYFSQTPRARILSWNNWDNATNNLATSVDQYNWAWVQLIPPRTKYGVEVAVNATNQDPSGFTYGADLGAKYYDSPDAMFTIDGDGFLEALGTFRVRLRCAIDLTWTPGSATANQINIYWVRNNATISAITSSNLIYASKVRDVVTSTGSGTFYLTYHMELELYVTIGDTITVYPTDGSDIEIDYLIVQAEHVDELVTPGCTQIWLNPP